MARFAHVSVDVPCPQCGDSLAPTDAIGFQWGYCPNPHGGAYFTYQVGEPLLWRLDKRGGAPAWACFRGNSANIGDPSFPDLVVRESEYDIRACHACSHRIEGIAVVITRGTVAEIRVYETIGSLPECNVITVDANGLQTPWPEWDNHLMIAGVNGGWFTRLIEMPKLLSLDERDRPF
jgi:hypothetical protein